MSPWAGRSCLQGTLQICTSFALSHNFLKKIDFDTSEINQVLVVDCGYFRMANLLEVELIPAPG